MQGFTDKAMNTLLRTKSTPSNQKDSEQNILMTSAFDMSGAITRLTGEMDSHPEDIIYAFANKQGKLLSHVSRDDFARYLYNATETMTKSDVQVETRLTVFGEWVGECLLPVTTFIVSFSFAFLLSFIFFLHLFLLILYCFLL